jgi:hypothetical protein
MQSHYTLAAYHLQRAEYAEALACTTSLLKLEPWHEEAHRQAMLLFALSGQRRLALAQYKTCQGILRQEFGVEPEEETTKLYERIKAAAAGLSPAARPTSAVAPDAPAHLSLRPLAGRADEFAWLMGQYEQARAGRGSLTLIQGAAGTGKTSLVEEMMCFVGVSGGLLLQVRCRDFSRAVPYQPVIDLLRAVFHQAPAAFDALPDYWLLELRQLLPELHRATPMLASPGTIFEPLGRQRLFEATAALLGELVRLHGEVAVFLDDLHNADGETTDVLSYLISQRESAGVWYVGAYRPELLAPSHPLLQLYHGLHRAGRLAQLQLGDLSPLSVAQLVSRLEGLEAAAAASLADHLYSQAGGNPLLTVRLLEDLVRRDVLCVVRGGWWLNAARLTADPGHVPPGVQEIIEERARHLPLDARPALHLAAVIGQSFDLGMLAQCSGVSYQETAQRLSSLLAHQFVREADAPLDQRWSDEPRFAFVSPLVWAAILRGLSSRERLWLGEQVSRAGVAAPLPRAARAPRRQSVVRTATCRRRPEQWVRPELMLD